MTNNIDTLRIVGNNLTPHLIMEGKTKITKPQAIIPGAEPTEGIAVTLETKDNNANIIIQKGDSEIQRAIFNYDETPNGYELVSATSTYFNEDKNSKEIRQNHYLIEPEGEKAYEHYINYANGPLKANTNAYIRKINSSFAQAVGYKSSKTDYDSQESHTYGKKSLQRDIPALLNVVDIIAPDSEITLRMKDKLKKDNKTSLVAFEVNNTVNGKEIARGFMSTDGDSVSYHINTEDMVIIGEQSPNKDMSKAYLKQEKAPDEPKIAEKVVQEEKVAPEEKVKKASPEEASLCQPTINAAATATSAPQRKKPGRKPKVKVIIEKTEEAKKPSSKSNTINPPKKVIKKDGKEIKASAAEPKTQIVTNKENHVNSADYYTNLIFEAAISEEFQTIAKIDFYKRILAMAYMDGYVKPELESILLGNGLLNFSPDCQRMYVNDGIKLAKSGEIKRPVKTPDNKIKELKNSEIDIEDEELKMCFVGMVNEMAKAKDERVKEYFADQALTLLKDSSSKDLKSNLLSFVQKYSETSEELKFHYDIYLEAVNDTNTKNTKSHISQMINKIDDANHHDKRDEFLTRLYFAKEKQELESLQEEIQELLNVQYDLLDFEDVTDTEKPQKLSLDSLSSANQKIVRDLLNCKSPRKMSLTFNRARNLLLDMGFEEANVDGSHYKFIPPLDIFFNGEKQNFVTLTRQNEKTLKPAVIDDLINICKQYYDTEAQV